MNNKKNILCIMCLGALVGCSSSGGGGGGSEGGGEHLPPPPPPPNNELVIKAAIIDHNFNTSSLSKEQKNQIVEEYHVREGADGVFTTGTRNHGGRVTDVFFNNLEKNTNLMLVEVGNEPNTESFFDNHLAAGIGLAVDNGARVINKSFGGQTMGVPSSFNNCTDCIEGIGVNALANFNKIITGNDGLGAVLVRSAGNSGEALKQPFVFNQYESHPELMSRTIIAGGSVSNGNDIHNLSNYPGADEVFQSMYITAPFLHDIDGVLRGGTSFAAPVIASYATSILEEWPHLSAEEVVTRLIDTASQHSSLYSQNDCGESGDLNCGFYYMGQGEADIVEAFNPQGQLKIPTSDSVDGKYTLPENTIARTSMLYGDALHNTEALRGIAVFDELGRDYKIDLSDHIMDYSSYRDRVLRQMNNVISSSQSQVQHTTMMNENNFRMDLFESPNGNVEAKMMVNFGNTNLYASQKENPYGDIQLSNSPSIVSSMSSSVHYNSDIMPNAMNRVGFQYNFMDNVSFYSEYEKTSDISMVANEIDNKNNHFERYNIGTNFGFGNLSLNLNTSYQERGSEAFGMRGSGFFEMNDKSPVTAVSMTTEYAFNNNLSVYSMLERSYSKSVSSEFVNISGLDTFSYGAGVNWKKNNHKAVLSVVQPPQISGGYATFSIPIGRTNEGNVIRENRTVDLSPSGRQTDIELAYRYQREQDNQYFQFNYLHVDQPGHVRDAKSDNAVMVTWGRTF